MYVYIYIYIHTQRQPANWRRPSSHARSGQRIARLASRRGRDKRGVHGRPQTPYILQYFAFSAHVLPHFATFCRIYHILPHGPRMRSTRPATRILARHLLPLQGQGPGLPRAALVLHGDVPGPRRAWPLFGLRLFV